VSVANFHFVRTKATNDIVFAAKGKKEGERDSDFVKSPPDSVNIISLGAGPTILPESDFGENSTLQCGESDENKKNKK